MTRTTKNIFVLYLKAVAICYFHLFVKKKQANIIYYIFSETSILGFTFRDTA